nr:RecName: Full=Lymna-DF-amide 4 [Lymnaea stagnalis]AAB26365.1 lymnaDFamide 4=neuropeptide homolog [Lymnaea stagnalis=snails, ganglia, Peptide, 13 aa] [Lymnaea stagnalis]
PFDRISNSAFSDF